MIRFRLCFTALSVLSAAVVGGLPGTSGSAFAAACAIPKGVYAASTPWAQRQLDLPAVATLSAGTGQRIAVIGTGIDASNPQFAAGQVLAGQDVRAGGSARTDCDGRGTFAAGIIGAQADPRTTIVGVAPAAQLIPIRYTQSGSDDNATATLPSRLASAFDVAVAAHAGIIEVAVPVTVDSAALRAAVARAVRAGVLVVSPAAAAKAGESTYPTSYPGVVAVAGVRADGSVSTVESGSYLAISAPGNDLAGLAAGSKGALGHLWPANDPSFAAAYVAGVLADVASYLPRLSRAQVLARVLATSGSSDGRRDDRVGWGLIDPVRALTAELPTDVSPQSMAGRPVVVAGSVPLARPVRASTPTGRRAGYLAAGGLTVALVIGLAAAAIRRGQRRGWRAERAKLPAGSAR